MHNLEKEKLAKGIVQKLRRAGFAAYFVGGCVRDMLMRKSPKDFDIATCARTAQIKKVFPGQTYPVGEQFGSVLVVQKKIPFQVSVFRNEAGRYSKLLLNDVCARDFTINGLAYDPLKRQVIDLVGARSDIRKKTVRASGDITSKFIQDPLRLIRAVRFSVTLGFTIEAATALAITKHAGLISRVSRERLRDELILIFTGANPGRGLALLDELGLLTQALPAITALKRINQPPAFHPEGDVFTHTLLMMEKLKKPSLILAFSCLFHDIGKPATFQVTDRIRFNLHDKVGAELTDKILRELKFPNKQREDIVTCVDNHMRMMEAPKMRASTLTRLLARPTFADELKLHYFDCLSSHGDLAVYRFLNKKYNQFKKKPKIPQPLLTGHELIKIGFTPGPIFGKIHKQMVDLQLEGKLVCKTQAKKWLVKKFQKNEKSKSK